MSNIAIVLPSYREDLYQTVFLPKWESLFLKHNITLVTVWDGKNLEDTVVKVRTGKEDRSGDKDINIKDIMGKNMDLICNKYAGVRSLGLAYIGLYMPEIQYIVSLDDDVAPIGDPIQDHLDALNMQVPISWMPIGDEFTRGFPYNARKEAEVVFSHGVWAGVPDLDAPTQLVRGTKPMSYHRTVIPKGVLAPMSYMNTAFKRKMLPYIFMCPQIIGELERCDDIWASIEAKRAIDAHGWAAVTGFSTVLHDRASNVFSSLVKESKFIGLNEGYWKGEQDDPYFKMYHERRMRWQNLKWV